MARRPKKKKFKKNAPSPFNVDPKTGLPSLGDFITWLDHTPEAKRDFAEFCSKHKLWAADFRPWNERKDYACTRRPEVVTGLARPCGFRGVRDLVDPDMMHESWWVRAHIIGGD